MAQHLPLRILLAEDNTVNQKVTLHMLQHLDYRADVAGNDLEVLDALMRQPYDVVLLDVQMPEMDGLEATRLIRHQWPKAHQPRIIAMTANAIQGDREQCLEAGMDDYVSKPVKIEELASALRRINGRHSRAESPLMRPLPPAAAGDESAAIDAATLDELRQVIGDRLSELIEVYLDDAPKLLADLQRAVTEGNAPNAQRAAHTLKSSSAQIGAKCLSTISAELEAMGRTSELEGAHGQLAQAEHEFERVKQALDQSAGAKT